MTLQETQELWEVNHPESDFWEGVVVPSNLDRLALIDYLKFEYGEMETIDTNSGHFRERIRMFFITHKWNIDKLSKTLEFEYNPIEDTKWHEWYQHTDDKTTDFNSNRDVVTDRGTDYTENVSTGRTDSVDVTFHETDVVNSKEVVDDDWSEEDTINNEKVNLVSAFNEPLSTLKNLQDSEHHRDVETGKINKKGADDKTTTADTTTNKDSTEGTKEVYSNEEDTESNEQIHNNVDDDLVSKEVMDDDIHRDTYHHGNDRHSFQSLIEEERRQSQFNVYKWIGRHFSLECLVCIW